MNIFIIILIVLSSAIAMEFVAWAAHKYIMHGWGWAWHKSHHEPHDDILEKNDLYGLFGGALGIGLFIIGSISESFAPIWWAGLGVTLYGVIYTLVHDGLVHGRFFHYVPKRGYLKRLVQAHKLHHATIGREGGVSFGFVIARDPAKLKAELKRQREAGIAVVRDAVG